MAWKFVVAGTDGTPIGELTAATQRKVIWPLDGVANVSFTIDGQHPQALLPVELVTDLLVYDDDALVFRGRLGASSDSVSAAGEPANLAAVDYRAMLGRRVGPPGATYSALDQAQIAWNLIAFAQGQDGGALGITQGAGASTGVARTYSPANGAYVADSINQIAALGDGFEWEIDSALGFNVYYPRRGVDTETVLEYGGTVVSFGRTFDTTKFANAVRYAGVGTLTPILVESPDIAAGPVPPPGTPGRFDLAVSDTTITDATVLGLRAAYELSTDDRPPASYQMVLKPGWWTPQQLWLGDTTQLVLRSGRVNEVSRQRVTQIEVDPGDDGGEVVTVTTGPIPGDQGTEVEAQLRRLTLLELSQ